KSRRWPGPCLRRSRASGRVTLRATMPARRAAPRSASAPAAMCWSAAPTIPSRCSRSACKARSESTSPPVSRAWNFVRDVDVPRMPLSVNNGERFWRAACTSHRSDDFSLAKTFGQAEHERLPTQSRAELRTNGDGEMGQDVRSPRGPRCIALVGPFQSGKTTLLEAILARTGAIPKAGSVDAGTSLGDASPEARHHKMSVGLTAATTTFMGDSYTFIDCPGSVEFAHDMR